MELEAFHGLLTPAGAALLAEVVAAGVADDGAALALGSRLRRHHPPDLVAAAITQARLRERARVKFGTAAASMYFTPAGLEQSTRAYVAAHRAARFARAFPAGGEPVRVADLCAGIGADLLALAAHGLATTGVEADPLTAAVAAANATAATARPRRRRGRDRARPNRLRRGVLRPVPAVDPRAGLRPRRVRPALDVRPGAADSRRRRPPARGRAEGRAGHPARARATRRRGRVGVRARRGQGGRPVRRRAGRRRAGRPRPAPRDPAARRAHPDGDGRGHRRGAAPGRAAAALAVRAGRRGRPLAPRRRRRRCSRRPPA